MKAIFYPPAQAFLCYHEFSGSKPTHVYLAGIGSGSTGVYPGLIHNSELASYHTLMPDFLGFGYSDRPDDFGYTIDEHADSITHLLDQLQVTGCTVIGASMGGAVAITLATKRPDLVGRLILAEGVLDAMDPLEIASQSEEQYIAGGHRIFLEQFRQMILQSPHPNDLIFGLMWKLVPPHAFHRSAVSMAKGANPTWREQLYQLKIPRLYIWGSENFRSEYTETLTEHGMQIAVVPHAGHPMMNHNPADFVRVISAFIAH